MFATDRVGKGVWGCLLGFLQSDSSINTWDSDNDDGRQGAKCSLVLACFLESGDNGNKQQHKWTEHQCVCVCVWVGVQIYICLQHTWVNLFGLTELYGWCVHCQDKRQIYLCLILEECMGSHHSSYYLPFASLTFLNPLLRSLFASYLLSFSSYPLYFFFSFSVASDLMFIISLVAYCLYIRSQMGSPKDMKNSSKETITEKLPQLIKNARHLFSIVEFRS